MESLELSYLDNTVFNFDYFEKSCINTKIKNKAAFNSTDEIETEDVTPAE